MIRYTTPTHTIVVCGYDLTDCDVVVSYRQRIGNSTNTNRVDVENPTATYDGTDTTLTVPLTQLQTGGFRAGVYAQVQVNFMEDGVRKATEMASIVIDENLLCVGWQLYRVTRAIAIGEAITAGTNVTATTVAAEIAAIQ